MWSVQMGYFSLSTSAGSPAAADGTFVRGTSAGLVAGVPVAVSFATLRS
ncbi:MAG: hypothetical protein WAV09_02235 [Minisyncoccia bacterium]